MVTVRFFIVFFWVAAFIHGALALVLSLAPELARESLSGQGSTFPLLLFQTEGLLYLLLAAAFAYVANNTGKGAPVVALITFTKVLMPLYTYSAFHRNEISITHVGLDLSLDLIFLPFLIAYFLWFNHTPRPNRFVPLIGLFGSEKKKR